MCKFAYFEDFCQDIIEKNLESHCFDDLVFFSYKKVKIKVPDVSKDKITSEKKVVNKGHSNAALTDKLVLRPLSSYSFHISGEGFYQLRLGNDIFAQLFGSDSAIYPHHETDTLKLIEEAASKKGWGVYNGSGIKSRICTETLEQNVSHHTGWLLSLEPYNFGDLKQFIIIKPSQGVDINSSEYKTLVQLSIRKLKNTIQNSLNYINESSKKTKNLLNEVAQKNICDISVEKTLLSLVALFQEEYGNSLDETKELGDISLLKNEFQSNTWRVISPIPSPEYEGIVKRRVEEFYYRRKTDDDSLLAYENRMPIGFKRNGTYFLLVPVAKSYEKEYFRYVILITHNRPLDQFVLTNLNASLADYFTKFIETEKFTLLSSLQSIALGVPFNKNHRDYADLEELLSLNSLMFDNKKKLQLLAAYALRRIVKITNAHSATIRLYDPQKRSLKLFVDVYNDEENAQRDKHLDEITFSSYRYGEDQGKSMNCSMFLMKDSHYKAVYEGQLITYDKQTKADSGSENKGASKKRMKRKALQVREQTASELCMPFYYKNIKIGVMNFESPILNGFDSECIMDSEYSLHNKRKKPLRDENGFVEIKENSFLYAVKMMLENYYTLLLERNDSHFLSRLIERESYFHDLQNLLDSNEDLNQYRDKIIQLVENIRQDIREDEKSTLKCLVDVREEALKEHIDNMGDFSHEIMPAYEQNLIVDSFLIEHSSKIKISSDMRLSLECIYRNLLVNFFNYANPDRGDKLQVVFEEKTRCLYINQVMKRALPTIRPEHRYFETLITKNTMRGEKIHSGLFIVGTLVRQLGGYIYLDEDDVGFTNGFKIRIKIREIN